MWLNFFPNLFVLLLVLSGPARAEYPEAAFVPV